MVTHKVPFGDQEQFGASEVLQMLCLGGRSGMLYLSGGGVNARLQLAHGRVTQGDFGTGLELDELTALPVDAQVRLLRADIQRVLVAVLSWKSGTATFEATSDDVWWPHQFDLDSLLIDAVRVIDEWRQAGESVPGTGAVLIQTEPATESQIASMSPLARGVYALTGARIPLGEIARQLHAPDLDVAREAQGLLEAKLVQEQRHEAVAPAQVQLDQQIEEALTIRILALQTRLAAVMKQRNQERRTLQLISSLLETLSAFATQTTLRPEHERDTARAWIQRTLRSFQQRYEALDLLTYSEGMFDSGDLLTSYRTVGGNSRELFYAQIACGVYALITSVAIHIVDEQLVDRHVADSLRGTVAAFFLELESAIQTNITSGPGLIDPEWAAARREHFPQVA